MTIEEKAKAYDEALELARDYYKANLKLNNADENLLLEDIFPELRGDEDEKIRKALVDALNKNLGNGIEKYGTTLNAALAWLEKQGESYTKNDVDDAYLKGICDAKHELEKQGNNTPTIIWHNIDEKPEEMKELFCEWESDDSTWHDVAFYDEESHTFRHAKMPINVTKWVYVDELLEKQGEQKPIDYNKELKKCRENPLYFFNKYVKLKVQKPAWSEEDEKIRNALIKGVEHCKASGWTNFGNNVDIDVVLAWLRKQSTPAKLSEEEQNSFAKGVLSRCALSFINYLDAHSYEGKMCVSNGECEDIDYAFHNAMWDRLHRYYCKYIEKQGEQKPIVDFKAKDWYVSKVDGKIHDMTYNPTYKVEPKFKVGDFIVNDYCMGRVIEITNDAYLLDTEQGIPFSCSNTRLWDVTKDAKDGDMLYSKKHNLIWIYKDNKHYYASINLNYADAVSFDNGIVIPSDVCPANRVQKSILFQKMEEAGFEWDSEKLELKKIEDEIEIPFGAKDSELQEDTYYIPKGFHAEIDDDKVIIKKGEKPTEWSDEDENYLQSAENACEYQYGKNTSTILWLKSLKDRIGG